MRKRKRFAALKFSARLRAAHTFFVARHFLYLYKSQPRACHTAQMEGTSPFQRRADHSFPPRSLKIKSLKLSSLYYSRPPAINFLKNLQTWGKNACIFAFSFI